MNQVSGVYWTCMQIKTKQLVDRCICEKYSPTFNKHSSSFPQMNPVSALLLCSEETCTDSQPKQCNPDHVCKKDKLTTEIHGAKRRKLKIHEIFKHNGNFKVSPAEMLPYNTSRLYCSLYFAIIKQMHVIDLERLPHKTLISDIKAPFKPLQLVLNREQNQEFTILS